jgi:hypothetical protein
MKKPFSHFISNEAANRNTYSRTATRFAVSVGVSLFWVLGHQSVRGRAIIISDKFLNKNE